MDRVPSNYTYAEATWTQQLPDWIGSHVRTFEFIGGCPEIVVPDNLKSGVHKPSFYDPLINRTYGAMAAHYSVTVLPARSGKPRDKAKVEQGVLLVQRWILARLRKQRFFSLAEANRAIAELLAGLNSKAFKKLPGSRCSAFEELDRPALKPLPALAYQYADWKVARVGILCGEAISVALAQKSGVQRRSPQSEGHRNPVTVIAGTAAGRIPFGAAASRRMAAVAPRYATSSPGRSARKCWWC